uniref:Uncharacterized protein n=1 Tax=Esox lucius TaxID=8010 RepID=A0A3P8YJW3_ESOLU
MHRLNQRCLLSLLTGVLLLVPICWGEYRDNYDYSETTGTPDYDYNSTFEYNFYSNVSTDELEQFLSNNDIGENTAEDEITTVSTTDSTTVSAKGSRITPPCFLLTLGLTVHQLGQLL